MDAAQEMTCWQGRALQLQQQCAFDTKSMSPKQISFGNLVWIPILTIKHKRCVVCVSIFFQNVCGSELSSDK
jgi:hypothetical protein